MTPFTASIMWCVLQVTLFAAATGTIYLLATKLRFAPGNAAASLTGGLGLILVLTLLAGSPWPRWAWQEDSSPSPIPEISVSEEISVSTSTSDRKPLVAEQPSATPYSAAWEAFTQALTSPVNLEETAEAPATRDWTTVMWWFAVTCLIASVSRLAWGVWQVRQLLQRSSPLESATLTALAADLREKLSVGREVALRQSSDLVTAATVGWRRQHILLPAAWREWTDDETRAVLAHELSHVAAGDFRSWLVARLAVAIHFYHPLVRWLASRLQLEQELAADAAAARLMGGRQRYLECLASLALATPNHRVAGPARTLIPSRSLLMRRIEMLRTVSNNELRTKFSPLFRAISVGLMILIALSIAGLRRPTASQAQQPPIASNSVEPGGPTERIPLTYVPPGAAFVVSVRPAECLTDQRLIDEIDESLKSVLRRNAGVSVGDVAEAIMVFPDGSSTRTIVRFRTQLACSRAFDAAMKGPQPKVPGPIRLEQLDDPRVFRNGVEQFARLDEKTMAIEEYGRVESRGGQLPPYRSEGTHPWADQWNQHDRDQFVAVVSISHIRAEYLQGLQEAVSFEAVPSEMLLMVPLVEHVDWAVAGTALQEKLSLKLFAQCDEESHAQEVANLLQAFMTIGGTYLEQQRGAVLAEVGRNLPENTNIGFPPEYERLFTLAQEFASRAKPMVNGNRVELSFESELFDGDAAVNTAQVLLPAVMAARQAEQITTSQNNLKQIALAMMFYESEHRHFPPAVLYQEGSPYPYSWRVALLPYLEQQALYDRYRFDEPWDSEANKKLLEVVVPVFRSPFDDPASTNAGYFALVGPETIFYDVKGARLARISDGTSNTIMFVEAKRDIPWTKPEDIAYTADGTLPEMGGWIPNTLIAAFCDASVHVLDREQVGEEANLRKFITRAGGETVTEP